MDSAALLRAGIRQLQDRQFADAIATFRAVLALEPENAKAHHALGEALASLGRADDAIASYRAAVAADPDAGPSWNNLAVRLQAKYQLDEAVQCYQRALALLPESPAILNNLGTALRALGRMHDAVEYFRRALALRPEFTECHYNLGEVLARLGRSEEAIVSLDTALAQRPDYELAFAERAWQRWELCDWTDREAECARLLSLARAGEPIPPFLLRAAGATAADLLTAAQQTSRLFTSPSAAGTEGPRWNGDRRLRIGYFSSDFRRHPVALLTAELFERHDRTQLEVFAYSHGIDDGSAIRGRLLRAVEHFVDLYGVSNADAVRRIRDDGIDILIDLNGCTAGGRPAVLAARPAPVQASWLGYIGTSGWEFIDYVIADPFVVPAGQQPFYTERIVHLPHCYLPVDNAREIASHAPSRQQLGLPDDGFVFCCFSNSYKMAPEMFGVWMRVLRRVPGSVLWLLAKEPAAITNLRREAALRGIEPERLVFAGMVPLPDYLARFRRADLFLDTLPCSACTTGADALWAGLPILTCAGDTFAGRHAGSLLRAAGLPELVTFAPQEYEALAVRLATEGGLLDGLRERLQPRRAIPPLFDTAQFARDLEAIYRRIARGGGVTFAPTAAPDR